MTRVETGYILDSRKSGNWGSAKLKNLKFQDKCCAGTELNPNEIEMTEFHPYVEPEAIEDNRQNERELAPVS